MQLIIKNQLASNEGLVATSLELGQPRRGIFDLHHDIFVMQDEDGSPAFAATELLVEAITCHFSC